MRCPYCNADDDKVIDSRPAEKSSAIRRRRHCSACDRRFSTMERPEQPPLTVIKRTGERELFTPEKLLAGVLKATTNLDLDSSAIRRAVTGIEAELRQTSQTEIDSERIGRAMLSALRDLHEVAYLRFVSVYKSFTSRADFESEIAGLSEPRHAQRG